MAPLLLHQLLAAPAAAAATSIAVVSEPDGTRISYADLSAMALALAAQVAAAVAPHTASARAEPPVVAFSLPNRAAFLGLFFGITAAGCTAAPLNPKYTAGEVRFYLEDMQPALLVVPRGDVGANTPAVATAHAMKVRVLEVEQRPVQARLHVALLEPHGARAPGATPPRARAASPSPSTTALILHTSGTTGAPKGVPLTHANLIASARNIAEHTYTLTPLDRTLLVMPLFHVHGLVGAALSTLFSGGCIILPPRFSATHHWGLVQQHAVTWFTAVPTIHAILLKHPPPSTGATTTLRFVRSCSAALAPALLNRMRTAWTARPLPVLEAYAMTEAAHQMTSVPRAGPYHAGAVGVPHGTVQLSIRADDGTEVAPGMEGEVCVRGPTVIQGYRNNPQANARAFWQGVWFRTGDRGKLDPTRHHHLVLTGRIKELINYKGEKLSPLDIDAALLACPGVHEAVAFALPHDVYGEVPAAAVVLEPNVRMDAVVEQARQRLADFKVPVAWWCLDTMPKTATGKIQRRVVRDHCTPRAPDLDLGLNLSERTATVKAKL